MIFIKTLKNTSQIKNLKYKLFVMIGLLICFVIKKLNSVLTELFIRGIKLNISFVFVAQYYIAVPKNIKIKFYSLFDYKNSKQTKTSANSI